MKVSRLWDKLKSKAEKSTYELSRLIDRRSLERFAKTGRHIVCDIDKTYLETEFESLLRMARIAFEAAAAKVTVAGASDVLLLARWQEPDQVYDPAAGFPRPLHFVSSSPPQLRQVLEEKLMMDGLDWSSDTFKNQAYNLRMGRMDLLRQHVAYKSRAILNLMADAGDGAVFTMIGDNAESDAYIYTGIELVTKGRLSPQGYQRWLEIAGVEPAFAQDVIKSLVDLPAVAVDLVLIRNVPGYHFTRQEPLTDGISTFDNFYQAALIMMAKGVIAPSTLWTLTRRFHNHHGMTLKQLAGMLEAMQAADLESMGASSELKATLATTLARLATTGDADSGKTLKQALSLNLERRDQLSEEQLLTEARLWMDGIHREKQRRLAPSGNRIEQV